MTVDHSSPPFVPQGYFCRMQDSGSTPLWRAVLGVKSTQGGLWEQGSRWCSESMEGGGLLSAHRAMLGSIPAAGFASLGFSAGL